MFSKSSKFILALGLGLTLMAAACATAPYTHRRQLVLVTEGSEISQGLQIFEEIKRRYPVSQDPALNGMAVYVGGRIAAAANRPDYRWEFVVLENDKEANAFCLPGGKVGIFTGLLKYTGDEAGLATVISHEAAHTLARHAGERQSQAMLAQMGGLGLGLGLGGVNPAAGQAAMQGYSLGTQFGILLPYSRAQEIEADQIGLILMAKAGYDPALALDFWRRMLSDRENRVRPPQFLSSHPRDETRLEAMAEYLPRAKQYYYPLKALPAPAEISPGPVPPAPSPLPAPPVEPPAVPPVQPPPAPSPQAVPSPEYDQDQDDLELKPMDRRSRPAPAAPSAPPGGQWVPGKNLTQVPQ
jgi:predicted Zn-dependent protease